MADERGMTVFEVDQDEAIEDAFFLVHLLAFPIALGREIPWPLYPDLWYFESRRLNPGKYFKGPFKIAATILCPLARPIKGAQYQRDAKQFRLYFRGICEDADAGLERRIRDFSERLKLDSILGVKTPEDVIKREFSEFFILPELSSEPSQ